MLRVHLYFLENLCRGLSITSIHKWPCYEHQGISEGTTDRQERAGCQPAEEGGPALPICHWLPGRCWKSAFPSPWPGTDAAQDCHEDQLVNKISSSPRQAETWNHAGMHSGCAMKAGMLAWIWRTFSGFTLERKPSQRVLEPTAGFTQQKDLI